MNFIELIKIIILGIVEGITEWLPISSTGHMILVDEFIKINLSSSFMEMFLVVIQLGAIFAVVAIYFNKLFPFTINLNKKNKGEKIIEIKKDIMSLWFKILVACLPAGIIGFMFDDKIDELFYNYQTVAATLIIYGVALIWIENKNKNSEPTIKEFKELTYKTALIIGMFQVLALIPGTSRSGATIIGGILIGTSRTIAAEFTFYLAIPVMLGASLVKLLKFGLVFSSAEAMALFTGMTVAFIVSIITIKFLLSYIKRNDFKVFGWYRIVLGFLVIGYFLTV